MVVGEFTQDADLVVIGGGPGGYHAAFRAADHGIATTIIDVEPGLGGVCLHRGCIPSKTYLAMAETIDAAASAEAKGIKFGKPKLDVAAIRTWKESVVAKLTKGLDALCKKHGVERIRGKAKFEDAKHLVIQGAEVARVKFKKALVATGSRSIELKGIQVDSPRVLTSRTALELADIPETLLVIGGGYIGLELGQVYAGFGTKVTVVEMMPSLIPGVDSDLLRPLRKRLDKDFEKIYLGTSLTGMKEIKNAIEVTFEGKDAPTGKPVHWSAKFDKVLVAVGRRPNSSELNLDKVGVEVDERGFIKVDSGFKTTSPKIYAIGDVIGNPMLAHKAIHEGAVVADRLAGKDTVFEPQAIPAVVFTDPAIAWAGYTEQEAKAKKLDITIKKIPWSASGKAVSTGRTDGLTKMIFDKQSERLIGIGICGPHAGEMISEGVLALEMGAVAYDMATMVHPHPTLSEMIGEVAGMVSS